MRPGVVEAGSLLVVLPVPIGGGIALLPAPARLDAVIVLRFTASTPGVSQGDNVGRKLPRGHRA